MKPVPYFPIAGGAVVRNTKRERRQKLLKAREARRQSYIGRPKPPVFPDIVLDDQHADPAFAAVVREAVDRFNFSELPDYEQRAYRIMRDRGAAVALQTLCAGMAYSRAKGNNGPASQLADVFWTLTTGEAIFRHIPEDKRADWFPRHDFRVLFDGRQVRVQSSSLVTARVGADEVYHSRFRPTVQFGDRQYMVAFTRHVIDRVSDRLCRSDSYAGLGDVFGYYELCRHFEPCSVRGPARGADSAVPAISFFDNAANDSRFWQHNYVRAVFGREYDPSRGTAHYRVGYCPVQLTDGYAVARTFLPPGFAKTPEYEAISSAALSEPERQRLQQMARDKNALQRLVESEDFSAVQCYHANGVPQVVQTTEKWFRDYE